MNQVGLMQQKQKDQDKACSRVAFLLNEAKPHYC